MYSTYNEIKTEWYTFSPVSNVEESGPFNETLKTHYQEF